MAVLKVLHMKEAKTGHPSRHLKNGIQYILNPEKTEDYVEGVHCLPSRAYETMLETKEMVGKLTGRQGYHLIISFDEDTKDKDKCFAVIKAFVSRYLKQNYEAVYCLHTNTNHFHGHIIFNSVSVDGWKWHYKKGDWEAKMLPLLNEICREHGLLELEYEKNTANFWDTYKHGPDFYKNQISADIDRMIEKASHYEQWKQLLIEAGYEIKEGKYLALKPPGGKRFHRTYQYGEAYTKEGIRKRIEGKGLSPTKEQLEQYKQRFSQKYDGIPYGLTEYQKQYKRRLYRLGVLQYAPFSVAYQYRLEIRKLERYQAELDYLLEHNITDRIGVDTRKSEVENAMKSLLKERKKLYQQRKDANGSEMLRTDVNGDESLGTDVDRYEMLAEIEKKLKKCNHSLAEYRKERKILEALQLETCVVPTKEEGRGARYVTDRKDDRMNCKER